MRKELRDQIVEYFFARVTAYELQENGKSENVPDIKLCNTHIKSHVRKMPRVSTLYTADRLLSSRKVNYGRPVTKEPINCNAKINKCIFKVQALNHCEEMSTV